MRRGVNKSTRAIHARRSVRRYDRRYSTRAKWPTPENNCHSRPLSSRIENTTRQSIAAKARVALAAFVSARDFPPPIGRSGDAAACSARSAAAASSGSSPEKVLAGISLPRPNFICGSMALPVPRSKEEMEIRLQVHSEVQKCGLERGTR